jgi:hypothetical protein
MPVRLIEAGGMPPPILAFQQMMSDHLHTAVHIGQNVASTPKLVWMIQRREKLKNGVFWDVTPCGSCKNRHFGGT